MSIGEESELQERETERRHVVRLSCDALAVKRARDQVAAVLTAAGWTGAAIERARVVTSELATNAVIHAGTAFVVSIGVDEGSAPATATVEVSDFDRSGRPELVDRDRPQPGGMGLYLVDALAVAWGVERASDGKTIWARLIDDV